MDLSLFSMKVFLKVAETGNFTKAAEALFLSQPAVSLQIQKIEQLFQTPLFIRTPGGQIRMTNAGDTLQKHALELMKLQQQILFDMEKYSPALQYELSIGACCIAGEHLVPLGLEAFRRMHPEACLSLSIIKCEKVFDGLIEGIFDIGVAGLAPTSRYLSKKLLIRAPLILFEVSSGKQPVRKIHVHELRECRFIFREKGSGCRSMFEKFLVKHGLNVKDLNIVTESDSNGAIKQLVKDGYGISVLPQFMIMNDLEAGVFSEIKLVEGTPTQSFYLIHHKQHTPSVLERALMDIFLEHSRQHSFSNVN